MIAWLCLAMALLTGLTPAQGFMLCLEADGRVSVEIATSDPACGCCEHPQAGDPRTTTAASASADVACPCLDLLLPGSLLDHRAQPKPVEFHVGPWMASAPSRFVQPHGWLPLAVCAPRHEVPRSPGSLALIRSVVLLV